MTEDQTTLTLVREVEQLFGEEAWQRANDRAYDRARGALTGDSDEWLRCLLLPSRTSCGGYSRRTERASCLSGVAIPIGPRSLDGNTTKCHS